jgi:glycosyltransferase involved in cell wall biosynthesis
MERAVIELFESLRPEIEPHFLVSRTAVRGRLPLFEEIRGRGLDWSPFSDFWSWPMLGKPSSPLHLAKMLVALTLANLDSLRAARGRDAIYVPNVFFLLYSLVACCLFRVTGRRVIYEFHNVMDRPTGHRLALRLLRWSVTDFVNGSLYGHNCTRDNQPYIDEQKLALIQRAVPLSTPPRRDPLSRFAGCRNIVFIGQVSRAKGVDHLVDAFASVADTFPDARLHIVGGREPAFEVDLRRRITGSGVRDRISLWGFRRDAREFLYSAYVLVQPSPPELCESAGLAVLEAMAARVPAIVFKSGALSENVFHEETGLVCEGATSACLADCLGRMLSDIAFRDRCAGASLHHYQLRHTPKIAHNRWLALFRR